MPLLTASFTIGTLPAINFRLLLLGADIAREAEVNERHIPGGDNNFIDLGGKLAPHVRGTAWFANYADMTLMRDSVGSQGLLVTGEANNLIYTAILKRVERQRAMTGTDQGGGHFCPVEFVMVI